MKASDFIARYLVRSGVTHVYEMAGGMIAHLLDSFSKESDIHLVCCHHEQAAGFAAEGSARVQGIPGIALATSGPGATNLLTAIGSCYFDSVPAVFITGQVNTSESKGSLLIRQLGFQETDIVTMAKPICKRVFAVKSSAEIPQVLEDAFNVSLHGRQGPCLIDIPMDLQAEEIDDQIAHLYIKKNPTNTSVLDKRLHSSVTLLRKIMNDISSSTRPLLLMGGGCAAPHNRDAARQVANILQIPVVCSLMGVDVLETEDPLKVGFIGSYGNRWANKVLAEADLLIVLGSRLDIRQTGSDVQSFSEGKKIIQIDIDKAEFCVRVNSDICIELSIVELRDLLLSLGPYKCSQKHAWFKRIAKLKHAFPAFREYPCIANEINPILLLEDISRNSLRRCVYITDVGQHQMWAAQALHFKANDRFITSGGMGAMGFGLPAAIGAAMVTPDADHILISGDGSLQVNLQELQTLVRNNLRLKILVFNNNSHGMVRQFQQTYFSGNLQSTKVGYSAPVFSHIAKAYGIAAMTVSTSAQLETSLRWWLESQTSAVLEVKISENSKVYPKLAYGRTFGEMEPESSPLGIEST